MKSGYLLESEIAKSLAGADFFLGSNHRGSDNWQKLEIDLIEEYFDNKVEDRGKVYFYRMQPEKY